MPEEELSTQQAIVIIVAILMLGGLALGWFVFVFKITVFLLKMIAK